MSEIDVKFHAEAREEYLKALRRYIGFSQRVGRSFQEEFSRCVKLIQSGPEQWPTIEGAIRFVRLRRFPYLLYFERVGSSRVQVLAVAHGSQRPGYWRLRRDAEPD